ncbi:hypothetical protein [Sphingobacterium siyangense]|uniref:hypothetical protein n=1 Tax=Sphingobacterium siyangense TaxID=459529 RepID=UPI003DA357F0
MMRYFILTIAFCAFVFVCCSNEKNGKSDIKKNDQTDTEGKLPMKSYMLNHEIRNIDYEIYLNDFLIAHSQENNGIPGPYKLNQYIFSSGIQEVKIRISSNKSQKSITSDMLNEISRNTGIYLLENKDYDNIKEIKKLEFPALEKPLDAYTHTWDFEAEAPTSVTSLNNSQDLSEMNQNKLQVEVLAKYDQLRKFLLSGHADEFLREIANAKSNLFISEGFSEAEQEAYNDKLKKYLSAHSDLLPDLKESAIKLFGHGKAVALEQNLTLSSGENKKNDEQNSNYIIFHKPHGSDSFEVFRYFIAYSSGR